MTDDGLGRAVGRRGFLTGADLRGCGMRLLSSSTVVALALAGPARAQITENPLPEPIQKRGIVVEIREVVRLPETRKLRPVDQDVTPTGWARVSFVRDLPDGRRFANDSRGFLYLVERRQDLALPGRRGRISARELQPARERLHRLRRSIRSSRRTACSTPCTVEKGPGNPARPDFMPPGFTAEAGDVPQRDHRVARARIPPHVRSTARAASCFASRTSCRTSRIRTATSSSIRPRGPARRTTACSTRAAATWASATAAGRTRTTRRRRSGSTRSSRRSSGSIRAARPSRTA